MEVWRTATRFDADRGSASTWIHTMAHRRAVDRVRAAQSAHDREQRSVTLAYYGGYTYREWPTCSRCRSAR